MTSTRKKLVPFSSTTLLITRVVASVPLDSITYTALCKKPGNRKSRSGRKKKKKSVCLFQQQQLDKHSHIFINKTPIPLLTSKLISRNIQATTLL